MDNNIRYFDGKPYRFDRWYTTKAEATRQAKDWRSMGHPARVVHVLADRRYSRYLVYKRG